MDPTIGLAQLFAATTVLLLPTSQASAASPAYALAGGRLLVRVRLSGRPDPDEAAPRPAAPAEDYFARGWTDPQAPPVRLLPSAKSRLKTARENVVSGFEQPLVRAASVMVASGLLSFALSALTFGPRLPLAAQGGAAPGARPVQTRYEDPSRWELDLLVADVSAPAPHPFKRPGNTHVNAAGAHANSLIIHTNTPFVAHTNTPTPHTNIDQRPFP